MQPPDAFDYEAEQECPDLYHRTPPPRCRFCGTLCSWGMHAGKWRLHDPNGALHSCTRPTADDFEPAD